MSRIRGKRPTVAQMKVLMKNHKKINVADYLYYGEEVVDVDGSKCTSKNSSKQKYMKFIHKDTGDVIKAPF